MEQTNKVGPGHETIVLACRITHQEQLDAKIVDKLLVGRCRVM
jgi:hypothetical protein